MSNLGTGSFDQQCTAWQGIETRLRTRINNQCVIIAHCCSYGCVFGLYQFHPSEKNSVTRVLNMLIKSSTEKIIENDVSILSKKCCSAESGSILL
jgi:hypothetical protein